MYTVPSIYLRPVIKTDHDDDTKKTVTYPCPVFMNKVSSYSIANSCYKSHILEYMNFLS